MYFYYTYLVINMPKFDNPANLTDEDKTLLLTFFAEQARVQRQVWHKDKLYSMTDGSSVEFANEVVQRSRKDPKQGVRYEFISHKPLGKGTYGSVYEVAGTLALEPDVCRYKLAGYNGKSRVVKIQHHSIKFPFAKSISEYSLTNRASHLAVKYPTYEAEKQDSYTVMRKIEGRMLYDIINDDIRNKTVLTTQQRIDITKALLKALQEQVIDKGIIHRDIKPENILVDMGNTVSAAIIDFGFSMELGQLAESDSGTPGYAPPEVFKTKVATEKYDVFSMARVLSLIWRVDLRSYESMPMANVRYYANHAVQELERLFLGINDLTEKDKLTIKSTLQGMLTPDPSQRISIEEAILAFDALDCANKVKAESEDSASHRSTSPSLDSEDSTNSLLMGRLSL